MNKLAALLIGDALLGLVFFARDLVNGTFHPFAGLAGALHLLLGISLGP